MAGSGPIVRATVPGPVKASPAGDRWSALTGPVLSVGPSLTGYVGQDRCPVTHR